MLEEDFSDSLARQIDAPRLVRGHQRQDDAPLPLGNTNYGRATWHDDHGRAIRQGRFTIKNHHTTFNMSMNSHAIIVRRPLHGAKPPSPVELVRRRGKGEYGTSARNRLYNPPAALAPSSRASTIASISRCRSRGDMAPNMEVKVAALDQTQDEARTLLLSIGPIAALPETQEQLRDRLQKLAADDPNDLAKHGTQPARRWW